MTQAVRSVLEALQHCVQWSQHLCILREAWETGIRRLKATKEEWRIPDYQDQMLRSPGLPPLSPLNTTPMGSTVGGCWPVHMILWIPTRAPAMWRLLVSSRLVPTLGPPGLTDHIGFNGPVCPQLDAGGFFVRPLCVDSPFIFLLWPQDCTWTVHSPAEYLLPLQARLREVFFQMLQEAYQLLWPAAAASHNKANNSSKPDQQTSGPPPPPLSSLLPEMGIFRQSARECGNRRIHTVL